MSTDFCRGETFMFHAFLDWLRCNWNRISLKSFFAYGAFLDRFATVA